MNIYKITEASDYLGVSINTLHGIIKLVLDCYVPCMLTELFNDEHHEFLSGWYEPKSKEEQ